MAGSAQAAVTAAAPFAGWRVVALSSLIHNLAFGMAYGTYGASVLAIQEHFVTSRGTVSVVLSLIIAATVISAPILGQLYGRISIRRSVMLGSLLGAAGYFALAATDDWRVMLACYAFLVGPGVALAGSMPTNVLATNWFVERQGLALGIVNLPLGLMIAPMWAAYFLRSGSLSDLYVVSGLVFLLIIPCAWWVIDRPDQVGQLPHGGVPREVEEEAGIAAPILTMRDILARLDFWMIVLAIGVLVGGGAMKVGHLVPLLAEQGHSMGEASALLALSGGAGAAGSLIIGWLADRYGGALILSVNATVQASMWFIFLMPVSLGVLTVDAVVIGVCGGGVATAQGVLLAHRFGAVNFPRALGLLGLCALPFILGINPLAGYLHDLTGTYRAAIGALIGATFVIAALLTRFIAAERGKRRRERALSAAAPQLH